MGTSSSSTKKKRSKISSKSKASKGKIRSKTRRNNKHKKHQYRDDSVSYSSDGDDLSSSTSISLSSSDYDHRSRRSKSRTQRDVKRIKKKARRRFSSLESSGESPPCGKKRKRSKGKNDFGAGKKTYVKKKKKKFKRDMSVRSRDSGSSSFSTCNGGSSSTDKSDDEKKKGRSKMKDKDRKRSDKVKKKSSRRRVDLGTRLSCGPCSSDVEEKGNEDEEESYYGVNLRRLKSVIVVRDKHKDEMVYDHHDYRPSRSNDGNDGDGVKELLDNSPTGSKTTRQEKDEKEEEEAVDGHEGRYDESDFADDGVRMIDLLNEVKNEDSGIVEITEGNDLESILRQKALENLKKFKKVGCDRIADANDAVEQNIFPNRIAGREECGPNVSPANNSNTPSNEPKLVGLAPQQESSNTMEEPRQGGDSMKGNTVGKNDVETAQTLIPKSGSINGQEVKNNCGSASGDNPCTVPASAGSSNESSQFQQKTMTVMRGGEMVEVSYKVYIPTKASALARRQLKRQ